MARIRKAIANNRFTINIILIMQEEFDKTTQLAVIRAALLKGQVVTPIDALRMCGCLRLSARIYDLRHDEGMKINMTQDGTKHYARYWMDANEIAKHTRSNVQAK